MEAENSLKALVAEGFEPVIRWRWHEERIKLASFDWPEHAAGLLYAFVSRDKVMYIGMTAGILRGRMSDYSHNTGEQPARIRGLIACKLRSKRPVHIYRRYEKDTSQRLREETRLIQDFDPPWNL